MNELPSLPSLNGNPLAVVDVETTGRIAGYHEIIQIAIVPLTLDLQIASVQPFYINMKPEFPERVNRESSFVHGLNIDDLIINAPSQEKSIDFLLDWFTQLPLGHNRCLTPVAHNWGFERGFLTHWLGPDLLNNIFHPHPRDTMSMAIFLNDRAAMMGKELPFPRVGLTNMCGTLGIEYNNAHDAYADCVATSKVYSTLMRAVL